MEIYAIAHRVRRHFQTLSDMAQVFKKHTIIQHTSCIPGVPVITVNAIITQIQPVAAVVVHVGLMVQQTILHARQQAQRKHAHGQIVPRDGQ